MAEEHGGARQRGFRGPVCLVFEMKQNHAEDDRRATHVNAYCFSCSSENVASMFNCVVARFAGRAGCTPQVKRLELMVHLPVITAIGATPPACPAWSELLPAALFLCLLGRALALWVRRAKKVS